MASEEIPGDGVDTKIEESTNVKNGRPPPIDESDRNIPAAKRQATMEDGQESPVPLSITALQVEEVVTTDSPETGSDSNTVDIQVGQLAMRTPEVVYEPGVTQEQEEEEVRSSATVQSTSSDTDEVMEIATTDSEDLCILESLIERHNAGDKSFDLAQAIIDQACRDARDEDEDRACATIDLITVWLQQAFPDVNAASDSNSVPLEIWGILALFIKTVLDNKLHSYRLRTEDLVVAHHKLLHQATIWCIHALRKELQEPGKPYDRFFISALGRMVREPFSPKLLTKATPPLHAFILMDGFTLLADYAAIQFAPTAPGTFEDLLLSLASFADICICSDKRSSWLIELDEQEVAELDVMLKNIEKSKPAIASLSKTAITFLQYAIGSPKPPKKPDIDKDLEQLRKVWAYWCDRNASLCWTYAPEDSPRDIRSLELDLILFMLKSSVSETRLVGIDILSDTVVRILEKGRQWNGYSGPNIWDQWLLKWMRTEDVVDIILGQAPGSVVSLSMIRRSTRKNITLWLYFVINKVVDEPLLRAVLRAACSVRDEALKAEMWEIWKTLAGSEIRAARIMLQLLTELPILAFQKVHLMNMVWNPMNRFFEHAQKEREHADIIVMQTQYALLRKAATAAEDTTASLVEVTNGIDLYDFVIRTLESTRTHCLPVKEDLRTVVGQAVESVRSEAPCVLADAIFIYDFGAAYFADLLPDARELERIYVDDLLKWIGLQRALSFKSDARSVHVDRLLHTRLYRWGQMGRLSSWLYMQDEERFERVWEALVVNPLSVTAREEIFAIFKTWATMKEKYGLPLTILTRMMNLIEPSSLTMSSVGLVYAVSFKSSIETPGFAPAKLFELLWPFLLGCSTSEVFEQMKKWTVNAVLALHKGQNAAEVEDRDAFHAHVMEVCIKELQEIASPFAENPLMPEEHLARFRRVLLFMYGFMDGYNEKISRFRLQRQGENSDSEKSVIGRNVIHVTLKIFHNNQPMRDEYATFDLRDTLSKVHQKAARIAQWEDIELQIWRNQALVSLPPSDDLMLDSISLHDNQIYVVQKPAPALKDQRVLAAMDITPLRVFYNMWAQVKAFLSSQSGFAEAVWELLQDLPVYMPQAHATLHEDYTGFSLSPPASVFYFLSDIRQLKIILDEDPGALTGDMAMNLSQRLMNAFMELQIDISTSAEQIRGIAIELLYTLAELLRKQVDEVQKVDGSAVHASEQSFVMKLLNVTQVNHDDNSSIDLWVLLARAMEVMLLLLVKNSTLWDFICAGHMADFAAMLKTCLLASTSIHARQISCAAVQYFYDFVVGKPILSESSEHPAAVLEREVMTLVPVAEKYSTNAEFFRLAEHILKLWSAKCEDASRMQILFKEWMKLLLSHESIESADSSRQDSFVEGVSTLLSCLIKSQQETNSRLVCSGDNLRGLFQLLFLPNIPQHAEDLKAFKSRCYHERTRAALYELMSNLTETPEKVRMLLERITDVLNSAEESGALPPLLRREWLAKAPSGFCGMKNLSNTCYVNSVVTQLYMNPSFRQFVFDLPVEHQTEEPTADEASPMDLLIKLQRLFADLQTSKQKFIDPTSFIQTIKDYDGKPLDPTVQFDADEFFNMLFDRIEGCLPGAEKERLRKQYGGTLVQQVIAKECGHLSEREEAFNAIQCDIKGKSTLIDSLRAYVEGETMDSDNQYRCDQCQSYVDALKRTCIKNLPNHLIFHLKRFDFDFQTMLRTKLNDHFEFPMKLSMREFTYDYLRSKDTDNNANSTAPSVSKSTECAGLDEYELAGVLVHGGSAESGHYFSYARIRDENSDSNFRWFEFNDTEVTPFDPADIMQMCYGGSDDTNGSRQRSFNAYMLFYERVQQKAEENVVTPLVQKTPQPPNHAQEEIALENAKAEMSLFLADTQLLDFLACLSQRALSFASDDQQTPSKSAEIAEALRSNALSAILASVYVIAPRMLKFDMHGKRLLNVLLEAGKNNVDGACNLLRCFLNMPALLKKLILQVQHEDCRMTMSHVLLKAIKKVRQNEPALYGLVVPRLNFYTDDENVTSQPYLSKGIMRQFLETVYEAMDGLGRLAHNWDALFQLLAGIAELGYAEARAIAEMLILKGSLEFFAHGNITATNRNTGVFGSLRLGSRKKWPNFSYLTEFIRNVLVRCNISSFNRDGDERTDNSGDIDEDVANLLMTYGFWEQLMWSDNSKTALDLSRHIFAKGHWEIKKYACKELLDVFNGNNNQAEIAPFLADVVIARHRDYAIVFNKVLRALDKEVLFDKGIQWLAFFDRLLHCNLPTISTMVHDRMPDWIPWLLLSKSRHCRFTAAKIWLDCFINEEQQTELLDRAERMLRAADELIGSKWESCLQNRVKQRRETLGEFLEVYEKTAEFLEDESAMRTVANYRRVIERTLLDSDSDDLDVPQVHSEDEEYEFEDLDFDQMED
ncbi:hypothetical protein G7K_2975-t1 [Saitoella complicata NRRL Y-17804]|uniref:USP domain-containing protein n=2 Tax=Saitoella complicata (strain BCRC 22490 / CBS 7301 / JCM 7358 / NBRC 10748 / NRRL Y-17804) TaxID=698492 RepID=A0A0E9NGH7_SAICN|nr:hypothetical protein G7K_2975-t1 [Saitoella complicata NRRL Y-17804]